MYTSRIKPSVQAGVTAFAFLFATLTLLAIAPAVSADLSLCPQGSGAGQCDGPRGIAVDSETGELYVADSTNNRINVFDSAGNFIHAFGWGVANGNAEAQVCAITCQKGIAGSGAGQLDRPSRIAIDSVGKALYVVDAGSLRVQKFELGGKVDLQIVGSGECVLSGSGDPIAVGPAGSVYVADDGRVEKFSAAGACLSVVKLVESPQALRELAVDSVGNLYVSVAGAGGELRKYDPAGNLLYKLDPGTETTALGLDVSGDLLAGQRQLRDVAVGSFRVVTQYTATGTILRRWGYGTLSGNTDALAPFPTVGGGVFVNEANAGAIRQLSLPPPGPIVAPLSVEATQVRSTKATLKAEVNPEGEESTYRFAYVDEAGFKADGFEGSTVKHSPESTIGEADFNLHGASFQAIGLLPSTKYHFRVVAINSDGSHTVEGDEFETLPPLEIGAIWSTEVGTDAAVLRGEANPMGSPTTGYFEYVDDATYQGSGFAEAVQVPNVKGGQGALSFGAGEEALARGASLYPLSSGTTYHYRFTASNPFSTLATAEKTFTTFEPPAPEACSANETFRTGPSAVLPDCRAYELVSPLEKASGDVVPLGEFTTGLPATLDQSSLDGGKLSYGSYRAFGDGQSAPFTSQYIAERSAAGWQSHAITPPRRHLVAGATGTFDTELKALSPDLCEAWLLTVAEAPLAPDAIPGYRNLYRRQDSATGCSGQGYEALSTTTPAHKKPHALPGFYMELQGLSADGSIAIFTANDNLPGTLAPSNSKGVSQLYMRGPDGLSYVCILPGGKVSKEACSAGTATQSPGQNRSASLNNAISADGQRVFWTSMGEFSTGPGQIYLRIGSESETLAVSKAAEVASGTSNSIFLTAADDGSRAIFLTGKDLYEFNVDNKATNLIAHKTSGIMGASEDASRLYLVSEEVLSGANAEGTSPSTGKPNLYLEHEGEFTFVATLAPADADPHPLDGRTSPITLAPVSRTSRISPDGRYAAFMSFASPTGYDNTDVKSGKVDAEVYRYDVEAEALDCVSCNPSGARPMGSNIGAQLPGGQTFWAAAQIRGWQNTTYASRNLSADGSHLFFESTDALSPRDTNGVGDVYQWEEPGIGSCTVQNSTFSTTNQGCISLISSGLSARESTFTDASPNGQDVFFATLASLLLQDYGLVDIYDARAGGGMPPPPPLPVQCEGEACQPPAAAPPTMTPSSAIFRGPGNPKVAAKPRCPKGKAPAKKVRCPKRQSKAKPHRKGNHRRAAR
jgi:hypothetical protein